LKLIVGIGNPGREYINTRHNIGFQILDVFSDQHNFKFVPAKSNFWFVESVLNAFPFFLIKPYTYVNNTGVVIKELLDNMNLDFKDLLVVYDDTNLDIGNIRIRKSGGDGGHNGIKSLIYNLLTENFCRIRIGISKPDNSFELSNHVLSEFSKEEKKIIISQQPFIIKLIEEFIIGGTNKMLDYFSMKSQSNSTEIS